MTTIYAPYIANASTGFANGQSEPPANALALYSLMCDDPAQRRPVCMWDDKLAQCAQEHALDMATRGYFGHTTPEGLNANKRARLVGYDVPDWFLDDANNVESIAGGYETADECWRAWLVSPLHRLHVLGEESYVSQVYVGVGYFAQVGAPLFDTCWAMVSAPPES